ncbi:transglutaminase family protein [Pararhodobacter sp.]|uniref:transglutaminase-like domain-containing protein n=1 Tax=Pararhodobacter sp. TaxID=2127056 RepID=UPI002AFF5AB3|nr:transglutaminase family protein [Pararhodobacter sp.]
MKTIAANRLNPELLELFADSTLGLYLDTETDATFAQGAVTQLAPGEALPELGAHPLHVVLDGRLTGQKDWFGPGNHFETRGQTLTALDQPARVWSLDLADAGWIKSENQPLRKSMVHALIAADAAERDATPPAALPEPQTLCDVDHPEIRRRAARLRRTTPAATAEAVLKFVHGFPYRFGTWQERASDTLARGVGMCTTKTNLQVALMRAAGLEAGYVEIPMSTSVLGKLMPTGWLALQRPTVKHYFAAVKLNGAWHGADSSYDVASYRIFLEMFPWMAHREDPVLTEGSPYIPALEIQHANLFDIAAVDSIAEEMGKRSRFLPRHFEALNTRMDRARGAHLQWGKVALLSESKSGEARA